MEFRELQSRLEKLTNSKISLTEIGNALGIKLSTVSTRVKNNSRLKYAEIRKIEQYFNVNILDEENNMPVPITYKCEKIQNMINNLGIGIAAYGIYCAIVEIISEKGIKAGAEKLIAEDLAVKENYIYSILNDFDLFYLRNDLYFSAAPAHTSNNKNLCSEFYEYIKNEIFTEVVCRLKTENVLNS